MLLNSKNQEWDIEAITEYCQKINGIDLGQGISSLPIPKEMLFGAEHALQDETMHHYSSPKGVVDLRKMVADKFHHFNQIMVDSEEEEIIITHGATGALTCAIKALFSSEDEVILFEPFYPAHRNLLEFFGIKVKLIPINLHDFSFNLEELEQSIGPKTRGILICNPSNPLGKVFQEHELKSLTVLVEKYNLYVISDEIYEYITYDFHQHISFARLGNNKSRTITISGFSKTYNATGWRIGYAMGPSSIIGQMAKIQDLLYVCPVTPLQYAAKRALFLPHSYYKNLMQFYQKQRDIVVNFFMELGFKSVIPQGSYYALVNISRCFNDDEEASKCLIKQAKIATIPGRIFFTSPRGHQFIRVCFAKSTRQLLELQIQLNQQGGEAPACPPVGIEINN